MIRYVIAIGYAICFPLIAFSQVISGSISDQSGTPLIGATIYCLESQEGTSSDQSGRFIFENGTLTKYSLVFQFVGMRTDTVVVDGQTQLNIEMTPNNMLGEVSINARKKGSFTSSTAIIKTDVINEVELSRAACCDLAGCFGTEASVHSATTNIVTNTKELRLLGLSGVYNQLLVDGFPLLMGLSYTYGVSSIPGTLVENIYIAKGSNSVLQGYESISGQINVTLKDPDKTDDLFFNAYVNSFAEKQFNLNYAHKGEEWSSILAVHTTQPADRIDGDGDNFLDLPLLTRYSIYNAWKRGNEAEWGGHTLFGFRFVDEGRTGGQVNFDPDVHLGGNSIYGQSIKYQQPEVFIKTGFRMDDIHHFLLIASAFHHNQNSHFGTLQYDAKQTNAYANLQYEYSWKEKNVLKIGSSFRFQDLEEDIVIPATEAHRTYGGKYVKEEFISGLFAENTLYSANDKLTLITGVRLDHHNQFGLTFTPRAMARIQAAANTTIRVSAGTGWRTANIFSEQVQLLASSRNVIFSEELKPEKAKNFGINVIQNLTSERLEAYLSIDAYHTRFQNQIFPDYDQDATVAYLYNFEGKSISNSLKGELNLAFDQVYTVKLAYNYLDVYREVNDEKQVLPFFAKHTALASFSYRPLHNKWQFDTNLHWYGEQRQANTSDHPEPYKRPDYSSPYAQLDIQFLKKWPSIEVYAGCENMLNFRQDKPILSWQDPFGPYFDTSSVWGPTRGREWYVGVRYRVNGSE